MTSRGAYFLVLALALAAVALVLLPASGLAQAAAQTRVGASAVLATARAGDFTPLAAVSQLGKTHAYDETRPGHSLPQKVVRISPRSSRSTSRLGARSLRLIDSLEVSWPRWIVIRDLRRRSGASELTRSPSSPRRWIRDSMASRSREDSSEGRTSSTRSAATGGTLRPRDSGMPTWRGMARAGRCCPTDGRDNDRKGSGCAVADTRG